MTAVAACGGGGGASGGGGKAAADAINVLGCEPENPLIPADANEVCGGKVLDSLFTGLVEYDPDRNGEPVNAVASAIESKDSKVWTIKLNQGWKFHDGTEVKAKNFVDAWNWSAHSKNGMQNGSWFADIEGFSDVFTEDPDGDGPQKAPEPKSSTMKGLKVIDDYTFEVTLSHPVSVFPVKLGYTTFSPLPDSFFKDPEAFKKKPIGNGPFKFVDRKNQQYIHEEKFAEYKGARAAKVNKLNWKIYQNEDSAYADLVSGKLDFMESIPPSALSGDKWKTDLGERAISGQQMVFQSVTFPMYNKKIWGNAEWRKAISMAIDRDTITDKIFNKGRLPIKGWVAPGVTGAKDGACGEFCTYNPEKAKQLLAEAKQKGFTPPAELKLFYNADRGGHKEWTEAVANSVTQTFGGEVKMVATPYPTFDEFRAAINDHKMEGIYRTGWQADYPHIENFLNPLYKTGASSNDGLYSNKKLDAKLKDADKEVDPAKSQALYQEAEAMLAEDMNAIPLWYYGLQAGHSPNVKNVKVTPFGELDVTSVELNKS
ncbi:peptide ABC transporter substrate-binding protein [Bailinhaonella thermotolerans]|nr:ABC transporter substrate-binding protein [Bailinhaonella thermotolerans]